MGQTELQIFVTLATVIILVFTGGIILFVLQYHKRKLLYEREKLAIAERHLQELYNARLEIQEQTMLDIGREIHDNVGQRLTLASLYAGQIAYQGLYPELTERVDTMGKMINESIDELRSLSKSLTNPMATMASMKDMVEAECKRVNDLGLCTIRCSFNVANLSLPTTARNFILRILQEFVQNSLKHAACRNISVMFVADESGLTVRATDDGQGFDSDEIKNQPDPGIGLNNMRKRAELIGAEFSLVSKKGDGTKLDIFIPAEKLNGE